MKLEGIIPAVVTPMREDFSVDYNQLKKYIHWIMSFDGLGGVAVNMDTGEGPHLDRGEKIKILKTWVREIKGKFPVLAGLTSRYTKEAIEEVKMIERAGADGIVIFPIPAFVGSPLPTEIPYEYHKTIADTTSLPIVLFQLQPALSGVIYDDKTLIKLISIKNVIAIKEASFDAVEFTRTVSIISRARKKVSILTGNDNFILESFILGADGALIGFGTIAVAEQIEMFKLVKSGEYEKAFKIYEKIKPLVEILFSPPVRDYRARIKEALRMIGVLETSIVRPPLMPISKKIKSLIRAELERFGYKILNH